MVMLTMGQSLADDMRLPSHLRIPGTRRSGGTTFEGTPRNRLLCGARRALRALAYTTVAVVAVGGLPMICAALYDANTLALLFNQ